MKRFTFSALSLSAFSALLVAGTIAPSAQALPEVDSEFKLQTLRLSELDARNKDYSEFKLQTLRLSELDARNKDYSEFKLQTLRLSELDARNKGEESEQPYYPETSSQAWPQEATAEQNSSETTESTAWEAPESSEVSEEAASSEISITERRQQALDRS